MMTAVKYIGKNEHKQFGMLIAERRHVELLDSGINKLSQKITRIFLSDDFAIYCDHEYENIYTAGYNGDGRFGYIVYAFVKFLRGVFNIQMCD